MLGYRVIVTDGVVAFVAFCRDLPIQPIPQILRGAIRVQVRRVIALVCVNGHESDPGAAPALAEQCCH
jgi:hypothetical protein